MFQKEKQIYVQRIEKFHTRLASLILTDSIPLKAEFAHSKEAVPFSKRLVQKYSPIKEGAIWGQTWESAWFHLKADVPKSWMGKTVVAQLDFNGEGLVFTKDGMPVQSITNGSVFLAEYSKDIYYILDKCRGGEKIDFWLETAANNLFGVGHDPDPQPDTPNRHGYHEGKIIKMRLCSFNKELWALRLDIEIFKSMLKVLPENSVRASRIIRTVNEAIDAFGDNPENAQKCRKVLKKEFDRKASDSDLSVIAVGHAHIDTGWLWPVKETIRKCGRTFASQITLIKKYPGYVFGASQPQLYAFTKEHYPKLYSKIKEAVKKGSWECQGAMWVEADCNIISGESMVRQVLHGKNFYMDEFGVDVKNLWLPDVFGYSAALPQILKKSGVEFFLTQKLSWNQFNEFPHNTFIWRGVDGSEIITHFPPENNYNSVLLPETLIPARERFKENDFINEFGSLFGIGDGGGGPKDEFIERGLRMKDLEGVPKLRFGRAQDFMDGLRKYESQLRTWVGELYFELHRGTLTTQALVKRGNRKLEQKLRNVEFLWSCLPLGQYPAKELDHLWKKLLINQFHDIIPGSSIRKVYEDTHKEHKECLKTCNELITKAADKIFTKDKDSVLLSNCLSYPFKGAVEIAGVNSGLTDESGNEIPVQRENGKTIALVSIPPQSFVSLKKNAKAVNASKFNGLVLENELIKYEFTKDGTISKIFDKECGKEVLEKGKKGNLLSVYEDRPNQWDAWDIDFFYEKNLHHNARCIKAENLFSGPVRQGLHFEFIAGTSTVKQNVYLASGSKRIDFQTEVDWKEKHRMLRVSFPVNIVSDKATYDIQYSYLQRNTHRNTSWDFAKFEVVAHRYADLSDLEYGVAILNDCKYGHKIVDNIIDLNLLRSTTEPDPDADQHVHFFTYSLLPHKGGLLESAVMAEAATINMGLNVFNGYKSAKFAIPCAFESDGISMEVLKKAEKEKCLVIRLVETKGSNSKGVLSVADKNSRLVETDIMEWNDGKSVKCDKPVQISMKPFEIRTYKISVTARR